MEVLQGLIQDRVLWPLLPPGNVSARIETARARRAQLHVMLPDRSWSGIISKLFRMQATEKTLVSVLGSGYSDKTNSTLRGQRRSLAEKSHTWVGWTREEMDGIETRLHAMSDAADDIDPMDVLSRQTWLRGVKKKPRTWSAVFLKVSRKKPTGMGLGELLRKKLGENCRRCAKAAKHATSATEARALSAGGAAGWGSDRVEIVVQEGGGGDECEANGATSATEARALSAGGAAGWGSDRVEIVVQEGGGGDECEASGATSAVEARAAPVRNEACVVGEEDAGWESDCVEIIVEDGVGGDECEAPSWVTEGSVWENFEDLWITPDDNVP